MTEQNKKLHAEQKETIQKMDMLNNKVVKPLIEQVMQRDTTIRNLTDERDKL